MNWRGGTYGSALLSKNEIYVFSIKTIGNWKNYREPFWKLEKKLHWKLGRLYWELGKRNWKLGGRYKQQHEF